MHQHRRTVLDLVVLISIILTGTATARAEPPQLPSDEEMPFEIPAFDSSGLNTEHARLFFLPDEVAGARERVASSAQARATLDRLLSKAESLLDIELEPIDESWWREYKDKAWEETYPKVFDKTMVEPARYAHAAADLATAWLLSGEPRYADKAAACMLHLSDYSFEPVHFDVGMNYSVWGVRLLEAYDVLWPRLTAGQRDAMDACFTRMARAVAKNDKYWLRYGIGGRINNHLAWHKMMLGLFGLFYDRPQLEEYCLHGPRGLLLLLTDGLLDDGLWLESSLNYHFAAIPPMVTFGDCQRRMGRSPTLLEMTAPNGRTVKQAFDAMLYVLAPDGLIPPIGDTYGYHRRLADVGLYEQGWRLWGDPYHAWLLAHAEQRGIASLFSQPLPKDPPSPPIGTLLRPEHGYAFLRSRRDEAYWYEDAVMAFLTYDRSSVHANADKLSLMIFRKDHMLLSDVEGRTTTQSHSFSSAIQGQLNRGGLSQNTVMIDGADQRSSPRMLRLVEFRNLPDEKRVTAADEQGILYDGVRQCRTVALTEDYILDVFQVDCGERERQIDWIAHIMNEEARPSDAAARLLATADDFTLPDAGAWTWLRDARSLAHESGHRYAWHDGDAYVELAMMNPDLQRLILCGYPASDAEDAGTIPMLIARAKAKRTVFAAVWVTQPGKEVSLKQLAPHDQSLVYSVSVDGVKRIHHVPMLSHLP